MFRCSLFLLAALALSAVTLPAQLEPLPPSPPGSIALPGRGAPPPRPIMSSGGGGGPDYYEWHWALGALSRRMPVVTGAPYSADHITEVMRPPRPGAAPEMTPFISERVYRDSEGRTRTERQPPVAPRKGMKFPPLVEIRDPVAGVVYVLDMEASVAHRVAMDPAPAARGAVPLP